MKKRFLDVAKIEMGAKAVPIRNGDAAVYESEQRIRAAVHRYPRTKHTVTNASRKAKPT
jgi:hypothetical protein